MIKRISTLLDSNTKVVLESGDALIMPMTSVQWASSEDKSLELSLAGIVWLIRNGMTIAIRSYFQELDLRLMLKWLLRARLLVLLGVDLMMLVMVVFLDVITENTLSLMLLNSVSKIWDVLPWILPEMIIWTVKLTMSLTVVLARFLKK